MKSVNKVSNTAKTIIYVSVVLALLFWIMQTVMVNFLYQPDIFLYKNSAYPVFFNILLGAVILIIFAYFLVTKKANYPQTTPQLTTPYKVMQAAVGVLMICSALFALIHFNAVTYKELAFTIYDPAVLNQVAGRERLFSILALIFALPGGAYFVYTAFARRIERKISVIFGICAMFFQVFYLLFVYFDMTGPLNDPVKIMNEFALVALGLYLMYEVRFFVEAKPAGYITYSLIAFILSGCSGVSVFVNTLAGKLAFGAGSLISVYQIIFALYILARLLCYARYREITVVPEEEVEREVPQIEEE